MKKFLLILFGLSILFISCKNLEQQKIEKQKIEQQERTSELTAPDFSLSLINGGTLKLSEYFGKVIILDFWATWCPPCRAEIPDFISLYNEYKDRGLVIIGISVDDSIEPVKKFIQQNNVNYPVVMGNSKVIQDYGGITGIPTTFIIDKKGNIVEKFVGYRPKEVFEKSIKRLLSE